MRRVRPEQQEQEQKTWSWDSVRADRRIDLDGVWYGTLGIYWILRELEADGAACMEWGHSLFGTLHSKRYMAVGNVLSTSWSNNFTLFFFPSASLLPRCDLCLVDRVGALFYPFVSHHPVMFASMNKPPPTHLRLALLHPPGHMAGVRQMALARSEHVVAPLQRVARVVGLAILLPRPDVDAYRSRMQMRRARRRQEEREGKEARELRDLHLAAAKPVDPVSIDTTIPERREVGFCLSRIAPRRVGRRSGQAGHLFLYITLPVCCCPLACGCTCRRARLPV